MGSESKNGVGLSSPAPEQSPKMSEMIQSLKEIVNCPEPEIYATLKDCNMDPNETVQRLLSQDTFHEVKSKRERRKEMRETQESKPRMNYSNSSVRGIRSTSERSTGWSGQAGYEDVAHKVENVSVVPSQALPQTFNQHSSSFNCDSLSTDFRGQTIGTGDVIASTVQHSTGQQAWLPTNGGHLSMADIVRLGKPVSKSPQVLPEAASNIHDAVEKQYQVSLHSQVEPYDDLNVSNTLGRTYKSESVGQNSFIDNPPAVEQPTVASGSSNLEGSSCSDANVYTKQSNGDEFKLSTNSHSRRVVAPDFVSAPNGQDSITNAVGASHWDESEVDNPSNLSEPIVSSTLTDDVVSSTFTKLEQPNLGEESENKCVVVLPTHLQVLASDCSHLSFGTYKSGNNSVSTVLSPSNQSKDGHQESAISLEDESAEPRETRNLGHTDNVTRGFLFDSHEVMAEVNDHITNYELPSAFTSELMNHDVSQESYGSECIRLPLCDSHFDNIGHTAPELSFSRTEQNVGNLPIYNQPAYVEPTTDMLISSLHALRVSDSLEAEFLAKQSIPLRHGTASMSFSEDRKLPGAFPLYSPSLSVPNQHRAAPSFSQLNLPLEHQTNNMIGYSPLHQNYSQLVSSFQQQPYARGGDDFTQSLADLKYNLPPYGSSLSRFPNPGASASSGIGSYGTPSNALANYLQSAQSPMVANSGYGSVLRPRYSDGDDFTSLQQNGSSSTWTVPASRMVSSTPDLTTYYNLLGQSQQYAGLQHGQHQPTQYDGALGYSNLYRSQQGVARDHQQNFGGSAAGDSPELLHQLWRQNH